MGLFKGWGTRFTELGNAASAKVFDDFENGVGTYIKVIRFPEPPNPDGFVVVYLRSSGFFLMLGYWRGYERSEVAGVWSKDEEAITLNGYGDTSTDAPPERGGLYSRTLSIQVQNHTPTLVADDELQGWSLLGWPGPFTYVGQQTIIRPDAEWLPGSLEQVDSWINRISGGQDTRAT